MFLDNSACNLASFNLMKYVNAAGVFDINAYRHSISIVITAMEILVDNSGYPTESISRNSHDYRPLGLGYANLGALLMAFGLPYDSNGGRDLAAVLTAIMCGQAYLQSALVAANCPPIASATSLTASVERQGGACPGFYVNREPFLDVIRMHRAEVNKIGKSKTSNEPFVVQGLDALIEASRECWDLALTHGERYGYRNSQTTVLAPTGTIGFMMDCDTTGIEPDLALVKYKKLVGGGMIKIVNNTVPEALFKLGYDNEQVNAIVSYIDATGTIEGAPGIKPEHLACFDCSFKPSKGTRSIHYMGHIKMMAAAQPFLSGAISKTVNLPHDCTIDDIAEAYLESWRQGLKAVAIYRDGSKGAQPLNVSDGKGAKAIKSAKENADDVVSAAGDRVLDALANGMAAPEADLKTLETKVSEKIEVTAKSILDATKAFTAALRAFARVDPPSAQDQNQGAPPRAVRHRLPEERASLTHKFGIAGHEGYITVGLYPNGQPGEIFIKMAKEGSTVSGLMDSFATAVSLASSMESRSRSSARSSRTPASSPLAGPATNTSATPSPSWITSSAGSSCASSPASNSVSSPDWPAQPPISKPLPLRVSFRAKPQAKRGIHTMHRTPPAPVAFSQRAWAIRALRREASSPNSEPSANPAANSTWRIGASTTPPTPCGTCTTWATRPVATPAEPSWSATEAATAACPAVRRAAAAS